MNDDSILGNTLGQLGDVVKKTGEQVVKIPRGIIEDVSEQVGVKTEASAQDNKVSEQSTHSDKATKEFVKELYAQSDNTQKGGPDKKEIKGQPEFQKQIAHLTKDEQKKRLAIHLELHREQQKEILNPRPKKPEERPAEKIEKEKEEKKQMEALKFEEAKKKELPITVKQGTHEKVPGIGG